MTRALTSLFAVASVRVGYTAWLSLAHQRDVTKFVRPDSLGYLQLADNLALFLNGADPGSRLRTPGYPLFLWIVRQLFGPSPVAWAVVQSLLPCALSLFLYVALHAVLPRPLRSAAFAAALLSLLDLPSALHTLLALTETLFSFLFVAGVLIAGLGLARDKLRHSAMAAGLLGCALLVRPVLVLFPAVSGAWALLAPGLSRGRRMAHVLVLCLGTLGTTALWTAHNAHRTGHAFFSTAGTNFAYQHCAAPTLALASNISDTAALAQLDAELAAQVGGAPDAFAVESAKLGLARTVFVAHPFQLLRMLTQSAVRMLVGPGDFEITTWLAPIAGPARWFVLAHLAVCYLLSVLGVWEAYKRQRWFLLALFVLPAFYLVLVSSGNQSYSRFRLPLMPLVCVCAGLGARRLQVLLRAGRRGFRRSVVAT